MFGHDSQCCLELNSHIWAWDLSQNEDRQPERGRKLLWALALGVFSVQLRGLEIWTYNLFSCLDFPLKIHVASTSVAQLASVILPGERSLV